MLLRYLCFDVASLSCDRGSLFCKGITELYEILIPPCFPFYFNSKKSRYKTYHIGVHNCSFFLEGKYQHCVSYIVSHSRNVQKFASLGRYPALMFLLNCLGHLKNKFAAP